MTLPLLVTLVQKKIGKKIYVNAYKFPERHFYSWWKLCKTFQKKIFPHKHSCLESLKLSRDKMEICVSQIIETVKKFFLPSVTFLSLVTIRFEFSHLKLCHDVVRRSSLTVVPIWLCSFRIERLKFPTLSFGLIVRAEEGTGKYRRTLRLRSL